MAVSLLVDSLEPYYDFVLYLRREVAFLVKGQKIAACLRLDSLEPCTGHSRTIEDCRHKMATGPNYNLVARFGNLNFLHWGSTISRVCSMAHLNSPTFK